MTGRPSIQALQRVRCLDDCRPAIQTGGIRPRFSGHESFPLRFGWLATGVRFCRQRPSGFSADAMVDLGVGKNMVRWIRFWALEAGMIEAGPAVRSSRSSALQPTPLGERPIGPDARRAHGRSRSRS
ncbi:MAG: DUF4007 family protein [Phycisphaerales bacterium]|nr:DUF4007 family protein [Phycisphaerales bacterium]